MRKLYAVCVLLAAAASSYLLSCGNPSENASQKEAEAKKAREDSVQKVLARGEYLVNHVAACLDCHSKRDFSKYAGPIVPGTEGMGGEQFDNKLLAAIPGVVYARNITPDPETGIGNWTDDEILRAITQGINKQGDTLFPLMPYPNFNRMAKEDLLSIIAYIRTLKPIKNVVPKRQLMIPISMAYPPNLQKSVDQNPPVPVGDQVKYGQYLVTVANCGACHTPFAKGQSDFARQFAGGNTFHTASFTVNSANITPDSATGIGSWTEERFLNKFLPYRDEKGYNFNPGKENTMMPLTLYAGMKDDDLKAIYAYLRTVPAIKNKVEKYPK
ncbi:MAG TPA: cytochrome c [Chitinophagaceae bacterium]|nr:cytochrome c [Chitinophagaceae bacterium]